jgi:hypothetical protein
MARQLAEAAVAAKPSKHDPTTWAFHYAVVVTYGRPFKSNQSVGALEAKWNRFDDPLLQASHRHFLTQRDEVVAHSELRWRPLAIAPRGTRLPNNIITVQQSIVGARLILDPVSYPRVLELSEDLLPRLNGAFSELFQRLFPDGVQTAVQLLPTPDNEPGMHIRVS